jgi:predicted HTH domain antitoxin
MTTMEVRFAVPNELIEDLDAPSDYGYQSFVLGLYLDEEISFGKAAKLLGMTYDEFMNFLGRKKIPYFRETPEEISTTLEKLNPV